VSVKSHSLSMRSVAEALSAIVLTLWVGGLWVTGYVVAPVLFASLADRQLAGLIAGKLFYLLGWIGLASSAYLLLHLFWCNGLAAARSGAFWLLVAMVGLTAIGMFGIQPLIAQIKSQGLPHEAMNSVLRDRFVFWHGVSSLLYLLQSVLGGVLVINTRRGGIDQKTALAL